jgi:hypothetical protein
LWKTAVHTLCWWNFEAELVSLSSDNSLPLFLEPTKLINPFWYVRESVVKSICLFLKHARNIFFAWKTNPCPTSRMIRYSIQYIVPVQMIVVHHLSYYYYYKVFFIYKYIKLLLLLLLLLLLFVAQKQTISKNIQ